MATKFYLAEIPDDFPATNVKFERQPGDILFPTQKANTICSVLVLQFAIYCGTIYLLAQMIAKNLKFEHFRVWL